LDAHLGLSAKAHLQTSQVCPAKSALFLRSDIEAVSQSVGLGPCVDGSGLARRILNRYEQRFDR